MSLTHLLLLHTDTNINNQQANGGLNQGGTIIGVVGDSVGSLGGNAPHGHKYYAMEATGGFAYVRMDPISVAEYAKVEMTAFVYVSATTWGPSDFVVVWANSGSAGPSVHEGPTEKVLLDGRNIDATSSGPAGGPQTRFITAKGKWMQYSMSLDGFNTTVTPSFGVLSSSRSRSASFDYIQVLGVGPNRGGWLCSTTDCPAGSIRSYVCGAATRNCTACPIGKADPDSNGNTPCITCSSGRYASRTGQTQCTACPGWPRAVSPPGASSPQQCIMDIAYSSFEEPRTVGVHLRKWYECRGTGPWKQGISVVDERYKDMNSCKTFCDSWEDKKLITNTWIKKRRGQPDRNVRCVEECSEGCPGARKGFWGYGGCTKYIISRAACNMFSDTWEFYVGYYVDSLGGNSNHALRQNKGQHPVEYRACSLGVKSRELGFRTFYHNINNQQQASGGLAGGAVIGVIGDSTTTMRGDNSKRNAKNLKITPNNQQYLIDPLAPHQSGGGRKAPHGHQYYAMENTGGFAYVQMDPVSVAAYTGVEMSIWVHVEQTIANWEQTDRIKVWCKDEATNAEVVLLEGSDLDASTHMVVGTITQDRWVQYSAKLKGFASTAIMFFGLQSDSAEEEVWFDWCRIRGTGPDYSHNFCATTTSCQNGTFHVYTSGAAQPVCQACPVGKADTDVDPLTPCVDCAVGFYAAVPGLAKCSECPGYHPDALKTKAWSPVGSKSLSQCEHIIGFTSFEEPALVPLINGKFPQYSDTLGGDNNHMLINNPGQNPVAYRACSHGAVELGFRTFYQNTQNGNRFQGLYDGAMVGVIGNKGSPWQAKESAPHGQQYFVISDADGFAYVEIDPITITGYADVEMRAWVRVSDTRGLNHPWSRADNLKVWAKPAQQGGSSMGQTAGSQKEVVLLQGDELHDATRVTKCISGTANSCVSPHHLEPDKWIEYKAKLTGMQGTVVMAFGLESTEGTKNAWFDYFRVYGTGPDRTKLLCPSQYTCAYGTSRTYVTGEAMAACTLCPLGTADTDANPGTPCSKCTSGRYADKPGRASCAKCPGFPSHALSPVAATSAAQCEYIIGYTSFEEPVLAPIVYIKGEAHIPAYVDTGDSTFDHVLANNPGQNPVSYSACSNGKDELGFHAHYIASNTKAKHGGLSNGKDIFGVIGDITTPHQGDLKQGGKAPHGTQYFAMEETGGFAYVKMDPIHVADYAKVSMKAWAHIAQSKWDSHDRVKIWVTDGHTGKELVLLQGTDLDDAAVGQHTGNMMQNVWTEHTADLVGFKSTATMAFGLQSDDGSKEVWFDHFRIVGAGPDRAQLMCPSAVSNCPNGTERVYTVGQRSAKCADCSQASFEDGRTCAWTATGAQQWSRVLSTAAGHSGAHSGSQFMYLNMQKAKGRSDWHGAGVGYVASPVIAPGMRSMTFYYHQHGSDVGELSVDTYSASASIVGWTLSGKVPWLRTHIDQRIIRLANASEGSYFMVLNNDAAPYGGAAGYMTSVMLNDTASVSFGYHMHGLVGTLSLEAQVRGQWTPVWSRSGAQQPSDVSPWKHDTVQLPSGFTGVWQVTSDVACGGDAGVVSMDDSSLPAILASAAGRWDFTTSLQDRSGEVGPISINSKASRTTTGLSLSTGAVALSDPSSATITIGTEKTIAAWVTLRSTSITAGSIISINSLDQFDAIVFAERQPGKWMAGSNGFRRTKDVGGITEGTQQKVFVAIVYNKDKITMYRNGVQYGKAYSKASSMYSKGSWWVQFGARTAGSIDGTVHSAMLWTKALSAQDVAEAYRAGSQVDWSDRWQPGSGGVAACKAACDGNATTCSGFEYRSLSTTNPTKLCFWKNQTSTNMPTKQVGTDCYWKKFIPWGTSHVRFTGTSTPVNKTISGGMALDFITFHATVRDPPKLLPALACGAAVCERQWKRISGSTLLTIWNHPRYPNQPDSIAKLMTTRFETLQRGDDLATVLEGFIRAPTTGYYTFSTYSLGESEVRIMLQPNIKPDRSSEMHVAVQLRSPTLPGQTVVGRNMGIAPVRLLQGEAYYVMALVKTGGRGGHRRRLQNVRYTKEASGQQCNAADIKLPYSFHVLLFVEESDRQKCANDCSRKAGCKFFGVSSKGACWMEKTTDKSCPEGFRKASGYEFFSLATPSPSAPPPPWSPPWLPPPPPPPPPLPPPPPPPPTYEIAWTGTAQRACATGCRSPKSADECLGAKASLSNVRNARSEKIDKSVWNNYAKCDFEQKRREVTWRPQAMGSCAITGKGRARIRNPCICICQRPAPPPSPAGTTILHVPGPARQVTTVWQNSRNVDADQSLLAGPRGWGMGKPFSTDQWIQMDANTSIYVAGVAMQGVSSKSHFNRRDCFDWVTSIKVLVSENTKTWTDVGTFPANSDRDTVVYVLFPKHYKARYVRISPQAWNNEPSLRCALLAATSPLAAGRGNLTSNISATQGLPASTSTPAANTSGCPFDVPKLCTGWTSTGYWMSGTTTPATSTGATKPQAGARFMFLETSHGTAGMASYLISPVFATKRSVSWYYHMHGATIGTLSVDQFVGGAWTPTLWSKTGQQQPRQTSPWLFAITSLSLHATQLRFKATRGSGLTGDIAIDSVTISSALAPGAAGAGGESLQIGMQFLPSEVERPTNLVLVQAGAECNSNNTNLGTFRDPVHGLQQCATMCAFRAGCLFFSHAAASGHCWQEHSSSKACPEGLINSTSNFYALPWWITDKTSKWTRMTPIPTSLFTTEQLDTSAPPPPAPQPAPYGFESPGPVLKRWSPTGWSSRGSLQSAIDDPWVKGSLALPEGVLRVRFRVARDANMYSPRDFDHIAVDSVNISVAAYVQPRCVCSNGTAASDFTCTVDGQHRCSGCNAGFVVANDHTCVVPQNPCSFETALQCGWREGGKQHWMQRSTGGRAATAVTTGAGSAHHGMHLIFLETSRGKPGDASYLTSPPFTAPLSVKKWSTPCPP
eukprot:COSAG01_NODE_1352_length_10614_cov_13.260010_2_plen_2939_part_01